MDDNKEMSAEDLCTIFRKFRPELFNHIFKECKLIYEYEKDCWKEQEQCEMDYWNHEELNLAKAIVYDYGNRAKKIGNIIVSATD